MPTLRVALLAVFLVWTAVYLPGLGTPELKGEEGRRILPGLTMLDQGGWLVPHLNGHAYHRKPPGINWAVAAGVAITGRRDEWACRLPSALGMLALGLALAGWLRGPLGAAGALATAIGSLTTIGLMEKGRLIEIEALYIALTGLALAWWLRGWWRGRAEGAAERMEDGGWQGTSLALEAASPGHDASCHPPSSILSASFPAWLGAGALLGAAMLLKGPPALIFFYGVVAAVLWRAGEQRALLRPAHAAGLLLALGIFAAWAVPVLRQPASDGVAGEWTRQFTDRVTGQEGEFRAGRYLWNLLVQGWLNFLPWVVLLPLAWRMAPPADARRAALLAGLRWAVPALYGLVMLVPSASPRYALPLVPPAMMLFGFLVQGWSEAPADAVARVWAGFTRGLELAMPVVGIGAGLYAWRRLRGDAAFSPDFWWAASIVAGVWAAVALAALARRSVGPTALLLRGGVTMGLLSVVFALAILPTLRAKERHRPLGARLEATVPVGEMMWVCDRESQPSLFYLRRAPAFATSLDALPPSARYLFLPEADLPALRATGRWRMEETLVRATDRGQRTVVLVRLSPMPSA